MSSLIVSFAESSNHCILASSFLVLVWFSLRVLELLVILMTSLSSSKTEFACILYDVFVVGGFAGSSRLEVSLLYLMLLIVLFPTSLSLLNSELICRSYGSSCSLECGFVRVRVGKVWVDSSRTRLLLFPSFFLGASSVFLPPVTGCCCGCGSTAPGSTVVP